MSSAKADLETLLAESEASCKARQRNTFDTITRDLPSLVLFGAGGLGRKVLAALRGDGVEPLAFADNKVAGQIVEGLSVLTPAEAARLYGASATFVVTIWAAWADTMLEQAASLHALGCRSVTSFIPLLWKYPHTLPHTQIDLPSRVLEQKDEIRRCFDLWADEDSQREFIAQLRWRLFGDFAALRPAVPDQYWQRDLFSVGTDAVFADAGAYDGDTVGQFVALSDGRFKAAYAFEPDTQNVSAFQERINDLPHELRDRIHIVGCAVAEAKYEISFEGGAGVSSTAGRGDGNVNCVALDEALPEKPDIIKFDIEGFELLGLAGARRLISEHSPVLIVCAYHLQDHLWRIPLMVHSLNEGYQLYLRAHGQVWETVCYAVPG